MSNKDILEVTNQIYIIRDQKVMFDFDLAEIYGIPVGRLNEQVKRNIERFPADFHFKLDSSELADFKSQNAIRSGVTMRKGVSPSVFTEQGAYALSFILRTPKAIKMGIFIARAFSHLRRFILKNENVMSELKNNDHLSKTFSNFEKQIEQSLVVIYKNNSNHQKKILSIEKRLKELERKLSISEIT
ncbi:hypothetical protein A9Q84_18520 [Halobacteriovorax marinus]|uniref:KilA-N DNA-binding domain-containing protein n=1 Tax=Halobacteriovorax marinus TaxID=97084 RepID=A0A1Y5F5Z3_9BACT|nr:hypothetical protein A9Q84_18520 [Halobacteriovorax marinus]